MSERMFACHCKSEKSYGIQAAIKKGHRQKSIERILKNSNLDTTNYNRIDLLTDLGKAGPDGKVLAEAPGMKKAVNNLGSRRSGPGYKYEVQSAADLQTKGYKIEVVQELTPFPKENYVPRAGSQWKKHFRTDMDIVATKNGQKFNSQVKSSAGALNGGPDGESMEQAARSLENWIGAAKAKDGIGSVKIVVPPGTTRGAHIDKVLERYGLEWDDVVIESATP